MGNSLFMGLPATLQMLPFVKRLVSKPDRLVIILQRALYVAFGAPRIAPVVEGVGIVRLEPDRLVVILQRALYVAFVAPRSAPKSNCATGMPSFILGVSVRRCPQLNRSIEPQTT